MSDAAISTRKGLQRLLAPALVLLALMHPAWAKDRQVVRAEEKVAPAEIKVDPDRRVALVIGNSTYYRNRKQDLGNPVRDAEAMKKTLESLKFQVVFLPDAKQADIARALGDFEKRLRGAGVGLFYFAGHGVQMDGQNFLLPSDADMGSEVQVKYSTIRLDDVMEALRKGGATVNIVILDACRNNPFERSRGSEGGLAVASAAKGTLIAYATAPGRVAADGKEGEGGLYTSRLLRAMKEPGIGIEEVFKRTRAQVAEESKGRQIPWETTSLTGNLVLTPPVPGSSPVAGQQVAATAQDKSVTRGFPQSGRPSPLTPGKAFRDCDRCPEMVVVPAGSFRMGSPETEEQRHPKNIEGPVREVSITRPFAVGKFEVTFDEWEACLLDTNGCDRWPAPQIGRNERKRRPVIDVTWEDASRYVAWLSRVSGRNYRLLSEAEWEYAARAGTTTARYWGDAIGQGKAVCRDCGAAAPEGPAEVGSVGTNPWGLADMLGNVWEWVADCYNGSLKDSPDDGTARRTGDCARPVLRGGSWTTDSKGVRAAARSPYPVNRRDVNIGFRVATSVD